LSTDAPTPAVYPVLDGADHAAERSRGYIQGHAAGYAEGLRQAGIETTALRSRMDAEHAALLAVLSSRTEDSMAQLGAVAAALSARTAPVLRDAEDLLAASALELAEAVLGQELSDGGTSARAVLGRVLGQLDGTTAPATVRMNPADLAALTSAGLLEGNPSGGQ
jgi:flagellar assembly protein FliH